MLSARLHRTKLIALSLLTLPATIGESVVVIDDRRLDALGGSGELGSGSGEEPSSPPPSSPLTPPSSPPHHPPAHPPVTPLCPIEYGSGDEYPPLPPASPPWAQCVLVPYLRLRLVLNAACDALPVRASVRADLAGVFGSLDPGNTFEVELPLLPAPNSATYAVVQLPCSAEQ